MAQRSSTRRSKSSGKSAPRASRSGTARSGPAQMVFGRRNYVLLLAGVGVIVLGYVLMAVDNARGLDARGVHLSLDSTLSLVVAPLLLLAGYLGLFGAILWRPKAPTEAATAPANAQS